MWEVLEFKWLRHGSPSYERSRNLIRTGMVLATGLLACVVPNFGLFVSLVGSRWVMPLWKGQVPCMGHLEGSPAASGSSSRQGSVVRGGAVVRMVPWPCPAIPRFGLSAISVLFLSSSCLFVCFFVLFVNISFVFPPSPLSPVCSRPVCSLFVLLCLFMPLLARFHRPPWCSPLPFPFPFLVWPPLSCSRRLKPVPVVGDFTFETVFYGLLDGFLCPARRP